MKLVVSDPATKKAYTKTVENAQMFFGKKVGEEVELGIAGLDGYSAKIMGGSDKQGFPIKSDLEGGARKVVLLTTDVKKGSKQKSSRRGSMISDETSQLNLKVTKTGSKPLEELLGGANKEKPRDRGAGKPK